MVLLAPCSSALCILFALNVLTTQSRPVDETVESTNRTGELQGNMASINLTRERHPYHGHTCNSDRAWTSPALNRDDCEAVLRRVQSEAARVGSNNMEFFTLHGGPPQYHIPQVITPITFEVRTCTLGIVMIRDLPQGLLPSLPQPAHGWSAGDISSFIDVRLQGLMLSTSCINEGEGGWAFAGRIEGAIAVLMTATGSIISDYIRPLYNSGGNTTSETSYGDEDGGGEGGGHSGGDGGDQIYA